MPTRTTDAIRDWLVDYVARLLNVDASKVDIDRPIERYGLDSAAAVELVAELAEWLGLDVEPTIIFDYRTIRKLAEHVAAHEAAGR